MVTVNGNFEPTADSASGRIAELSRLRALVVDDHPAIRLGLSQLLDDQPDIVVVEVAASVEQARSLAERESIDVAVIGTVAFKRLRRRRLPADAGR